MDGAGRLARSLRSLGPQADLKAAAIGAVVLLRERLGRRRVRARPALDRAPPNRIIQAGTAPKNIGWGIGTTAAAVTDTALQTESAPTTRNPL